MHRASVSLRTYVPRFGSALAKFISPKLSNPGCNFDRCFCWPFPTSAESSTRRDASLLSSPSPSALVQQVARANVHIRHAACFDIWGFRSLHGCTRRAGCGRGSSLTLDRSSKEVLFHRWRAIDFEARLGRTVSSQAKQNLSFARPLLSWLRWIKDFPVCIVATDDSQAVPDSHVRLPPRCLPRHATPVSDSPMTSELRS